MLVPVSSDTKAIIGTIVGTGIAVIAVVVTLIGGVRADMREMRADMRGMQAELLDMQAELLDMRGTVDMLDDRLDALELALDRVVQRLLTLERFILPSSAPR